MTLRSRLLSLLFHFSSRIAVNIGVTFTLGLLVGIGNIFASALGLL